MLHYILYIYNIFHLFLLDYLQDIALLSPSPIKGEVNFGKTYAKLRRFHLINHHI
jgi:hypothetical protein